MNTSTARTLKDLYNLSKRWRDNPTQREAVEKNYIYQLNQLMNSKWQYALGYENEIPKDSINSAYVKQKESLLNNLEDDLIAHKSTMRNTEKRSNARNLAYQDYYNVFAEITWLHGGIYMLDVFSEISDENMPTAYMKYWPHMKESLKKDIIGDIYELRERYFDKEKSCLTYKDLYIKKLNRLLDNDWSYAFGHDFELPKEDMPERYLKHKANVVKGIENDMNTLAKQYPLVKDNDAESHKVILNYYDKFIELLCINGGIEGLNLKETLPLEKMPKVYRYNQEINHALSQSRGR